MLQINQITGLDVS